MARPKAVPKPKAASKGKSVTAGEKVPPKKRIPKPKENSFSPNLKCSFCGKPSKNARRLIALDPPSKICICDECVVVCLKILLDESPLEFYKLITSIFAEQANKIITPPIQAETKLKSRKKVEKQNA